jgi:hypothetical protein
MKYLAVILTLVFVTGIASAIVVDDGTKVVIGAGKVEKDLKPVKPPIAPEKPEIEVVPSPKEVLLGDILPAIAKVNEEIADKVLTLVPNGIKGWELSYNKETGNLTLSIEFGRDKLTVKSPLILELSMPVKGKPAPSAEDLKAVNLAEAWEIFMNYFSTVDSLQVQLSEPSAKIK